MPKSKEVSEALGLRIDTSHTSHMNDIGRNADQYVKKETNSGGNSADSFGSFQSGHSERSPDSGRSSKSFELSEAKNHIGDFRRVDTSETNGKVGIHECSTASPGDKYTKYLAYCIAIVAHDKNTGNSVMYHYDTVNMATIRSPDGYSPDRYSPDDADRPPIKYGVSQSALNKLKTVLEKSHEPDADIEYHISLGGMWENGEATGLNTKKLRDTFNIPKENIDLQGSSTAYWDSTNKKLSHNLPDHLN